MISTSQNPPGDGGGTAGDGAFKQEAQRMGEQAKATGKARMQQARETGAASLDRLADSAEAAAARLREDDVAHLSEYLGRLASGMHRFSGDLREKSGDEILRDIGRLARENPALFVTGSVAIGFGLGRFARASRPTLPLPADEARPYSSSPAYSSATGSAAGVGSDLAGGATRSDGSIAGGATPSSASPMPGTRGGTH